MSLRRAAEVFRVELRSFFRRPIFWFLTAALFLTAWGLAAGNVTISSGETVAGGQKAWQTSEFNLAQLIGLVVFLFYSFFVAVAAGMVVIRDNEERVGEILHSTPLSAGEYVWGKFGAVMAGFLAVLALQLGMHAFCNHVLVGADAEQFKGPFDLVNYVRPALVLAVPLIVFVGGVSFAIGAVTRRAILVFALPLALVISLSFLTEWSPSWLDPRYEAILGWIDPTGFRWLADTWLEVDRGTDFYNTQAIGYDAPFLASRAAMLGLGLLAVDWSRRRFSKTLRGTRALSRRDRATSAAASLEPALRATAARPSPVPLAALQMSSRPPGFVSGLLEVLRVELRELRSQPGLYLFVPLILLQVVGTSAVAVGAFDTPLLLTPGSLALRAGTPLVLMTTLLLLFYTVESLQRELGTGLASIHYATPVRSASILFAKALANSLVAVAVMLGALVGCWGVLAWQGTVPFDARPFALYWGLLFVPTFVLWCAFVSAAFALTRNRYATYGIGLGALIATGYFRITDDTSWVGNWSLWRTVPWSDMSTFELDRTALLLNRGLALALTVFFTLLAVRWFPRRVPDASGTLVRLRPRSLALSTLRLAPAWIPVVVLGGWLHTEVQAGFGGKGPEKQAKDYWRRNLATWREADVPVPVHVEVELELDPATSWLHSSGRITLENRNEQALRRFPVTPGFNWRDLEWTLEGRALAFEDRAGLLVFELSPPLETGEQIVLGFTFESHEPRGVSKNGGGRDEFVLPGGVVLTSFGASFVPVIGYVDSIGVDEENSYDSRDYPEDFYEGVTKGLFGIEAPFTTSITVTAPEDYRMNSVGTLTSETVIDGKRTFVWESDHPVHFFNVVGGRWDVRHGENAAIYYHPDHGYNVDEMLLALDAARRWYSEWFHPYPWQELRISEFPALAGYAQGFPTNIPFSEAIGFLTKSTPDAAAAFQVTAHEAAHQWWPNLVIPGEGPGGNILSEGMAHFSTILLIDQVLGLEDRIAFCKQIEERYGEDRQVDSERPLVEIDGTRDGDTTVTYDKGGWVFWMLMEHMGREPMLDGLRAFIDEWGASEDHPLLQDFVATLRRFAPDGEAYDAFCRQWFFDVVVPEYELSDAQRTELEDGAWELRVTIENSGQGTLPVVVAAARGERFPKGSGEAERERRGGSSGQGTVVEAAERSAADDAASRYEDVRTTVVLGPGESTEVVLRCGFEPQRVLVDPDARVLQLRRDEAVLEL